MKHAEGLDTVPEYVKAALDVTRKKPIPGVVLVKK
jgi:hypothetical protein